MTIAFVTTPAPSLTSEQDQALASLLNGVNEHKRVQSLGGYAGTGKSLLIRYLKAELPGFAVATPTGKAANVLRRRGVDASTIHSLIYEAKEDERTGKVTFCRRLFLPHTGVIVDEASMVATDVYHDLLRFDLPLIFVGDHGQLEPVGDNPNLMRTPDLRLETIHRNAGEISRFAEWVRLGRDPLRFPGEETGQVEFLNEREIVDRGLWTDVDQIICAYNKTRVALNRMVRGYLGCEERLTQGERLICLKNNRDRGVFNGMQGSVLEYSREHDRYVIDFESYGSNYYGIPINPDQFGAERTLPPENRWDNRLPFDYAYAITCHKAQGDEFSTVMVLEQRCSKWEHTRWAYTAASRAREKIYWVRGF